MKTNNYLLPDSDLLNETGESFRVMIWEPDHRCIILGQGNTIDASVNKENAEVDNIPVYQRPSGGETVVLSPLTLVISVKKKEEALISPKVFFRMYNEKIIRVLQLLGVKELGQKGISDICIGEKKILGSSIYRNKAFVLYHAVLNRAEPAEMFERYLKHPLREPDYRKGRKHSDFVTSLEKEGYSFSSQHLREQLERGLRGFL